MSTGNNSAERGISVLHGDSREVLRQFPDNHFDSVVTDPPYALVSIVKRFGKPGSAPVNNAGTKAGKQNDPYLRASSGFMGQQWDTGETAFDPLFWAEVLRVLKPGGHVAAFSGTRTYHRMAVAIEDAGFEIRDQLAWTYGSGFPKSHDVSKAIDKAAGHWRGRAGAVTIESQVAKGREYERTEKGEPVTAAAAWHGWGTALKPAWEPICLGRKPLIGTVAENVLEHGTGAINVDGCRVGDEVRHAAFTSLAPCSGNKLGGADTSAARRGTQGEPKDYTGRFPANIIHDGSDEVVALFPDSVSSGGSGEASRQSANATFRGNMNATLGANAGGLGDAGSAARFFYTAKADAGDRIGSKHPTVKPIDLMQWLVRLITPPGGLVLEPFAGSGTTGEAAFREGMRCVMIEREANFVADIERRISLLLAGPDERARSAIKEKIKDGRLKVDAGPLFGDVA